MKYLLCVLFISCTPNKYKSISYSVIAELDEQKMNDELLHNPEKFFNTMKSDLILLIKLIFLTQQFQATNNVNVNDPNISPKIKNQYDAWIATHLNGGERVLIVKLYTWIHELNGIYQNVFKKIESDSKLQKGLLNMFYDFKKSDIFITLMAGMKFYPSGFVPLNAKSTDIDELLMTIEKLTKYDTINYQTVKKL